MIERYVLPKMSNIWNDENKFSIFLKIELLVCEALTKLGKIPKPAMVKIRKKAKFDLENILKLEEKTKHDVAAFVADVAERLGPEARYIHFGMTSSDLLDTTLAVQCVQSADILIDDTNKLLAVMADKVKKYKDTICVARTHGVHAEPTTFGFKLAVWYDETKRNLERLQQAKEIIRFGKISGAVGTFAHIEPSVEEFVCEKLGLKPAAISTQIVQRDLHAQFMVILAIVGSSLEKFATEIRHLQKTEVLEVEETFFKGQIGSSAMPHKKNPVTCERICGLARLLRTNAASALENVNLWHERDISHSSVERVILPDSTMMLDYMLNKFIQIMDNLTVHSKNMILNLAKTRGLIYSQRILLELMKKGLPRTDAYDTIQKCAILTWQSGSEFKEALLRDRKVRRYLSSDEIDACFNVKYYLRNIEKVYKRLGL
ncbi:MAG: adenylosuccinate lyase [Candidatus Omnitrophica bacterium]|nr:adenylosuccinate lyase [Candidatus Omnitrophota bacterium]HOX54480.1 adenylosuccinate lyase [Candidatus Omnitrophota bacterium]